MTDILLQNFIYELTTKGHSTPDSRVKEDVFFSTEFTVGATYVIKSCHFEGDLKISSKNNIALSFENCHFNNNKIEVANAKELTLEFKNCQFFGDVLFVDSTFKAFKIEGGVFKKDFHIRSCDFESHILIEGNKERNENLKFENNLEFLSCSLVAVIFCDVDAKGVVKFNGIRKNTNSLLPRPFLLKIGKGNYHKVNYESNNQFDNVEIKGTDSNQDVKIHNLSFPLKTISTNQSVVIMDANIHNADMRNMNYSSDVDNALNFQNVKFTGNVIWDNSDLGKAKFNDVDFSDSRITFDNSYLGNSIFSNIQWPSRGHKLYSIQEVKGEPVKDNRKKSLILREVYRQLKNVSKSQSNNIDALVFYRNEMDEYYSYLKTFPYFEKISDKFILETSRLSNNYGLNWVTPIILLICSSFLFHYLIGVCIYGWDCPYYFHCMKFSSVFLLIVPLHTITLIHQDIMQYDWAVFWDFISRIFSSYFIFQIVSAFRKYIKN